MIYPIQEEENRKKEKRRQREREYTCQSDLISLFPIDSIYIYINR